MKNETLYAGLTVMLFLIIAITKNEFVLVPFATCLAAYIKETFIPTPFRIMIREKPR